jgi:hypothetical protein
MTVPAGDGLVVGRFLAVGGPAGGVDRPLRGWLYLRVGGHVVQTVKVARTGQYQFAARAGRYSLIGKSGQFHVDGHLAVCHAPHALRVHPQRPVQLDVDCQER